MDKGEKLIPETDPIHHQKLPDEYTNRLVDTGGGFETLSEEGELAEYAKNQIIYTGIFINPHEIYSNFPPHLADVIRDPHVTVAYRPEADKVFLGSLGSKADIHAVGYGNDGKNEGLLVEVFTEDSAIQKILEERSELDDRTGELKKVPIHITLSIAEGAKAVDTKNLDFVSLDKPVDLTGYYELFSKDGTLISDKNTIRKMKAEGFTAEEVKDADRMPPRNES